MKHYIVEIAIFFLCLCLSPAHGAGAIIMDEAYWEDTTAAAPFSEAKEAPYQQYSGTIAKGYTRSAIWLKLRIAGQSDTQPLAIAVRPAFLQRIELYDPALPPAPGGTAPAVSGRDAGIDANNHLGFENGFIVPGTSHDRDVYLRVTSNTAMIVDVSASALRDAETLSRVLGGTISLYFAVLLVFCVWALVNWAIQGDVIYGLFAIRQTYSALHVFVFFGLLRYFFAGDLSAATRDIVYSLVTVTIILAGSFDARLLFDFGASRTLLKIYFAILSTSLLSIVLAIAGHTHSALHINSFIVNAAMLVLLLLALSTHNRGGKPYGDVAVMIIRIGFVLMTAAVSVPILMYQNLISSSVPVLNVLFAHAVISSVILFSVLSIRARQKDTLARMSSLHYEMKSRELHQEQARRAEKERFLSMLTHELRNPLTVIRLLTDGQSSHGSAVQKAAVDMAKVIERVEQSEKLEQSAGEISCSPIRLKDLLEEIASSGELNGRLDLACDPGLVLRSDETLVTRILANLVDNAAKYGASGSRIIVRASPDIRNGAAGVAFSVSNEAGEAGLPDEQRLFSKYYRSQGAHRQPGSGLGLYLVKGWVEMLGGSIAYAGSTAPGGARHVIFSVWVPQ